MAIHYENNYNIAIIHALLPRRTMVSRKLAGDSMDEQVLAANIDYVFIISGLDKNFNLRRIERYITLVWNSGAQPVIILNKSDLINNANESNRIRNEIENIALGISVHFISSICNQGMAELDDYFINHKTD